MMNTITRTAIAARATVNGCLDRLVARRDDRGQGAVEYVGIILVVAALVIALIAIGPTLGTTIGAKITEAIDSF